METINNSPRLAFATDMVTLYQSPRYKVGDIVHVEDVNKTFAKMENGDWMEVTHPTTTINAGTVYDINKNTKGMF